MKALASQKNGGGNLMKKLVCLLLTLAMVMTMASAFAYQSGIYTGTGIRKQWRHHGGRDVLE